MYYVGLDIGGTEAKMGILGSSGKLLHIERYPMDLGLSPGQTLDEILSRIEGHLTSKDIAGLGVGLPGILDEAKTCIKQVPNLPGWEGYPIQEHLQSRVTQKVFLENDASMAALGEHWAGAGKSTDSMLMITLGSGVGGALVYRGQILELNGFSSEIGHMVIDYDGPLCRCGRRGCLETYAGRYGLQRLLAEQIKQNKSGPTCQLKAGATPREISQKAARGYEPARQILRDSGHALGIGISNILNLIRPETIVIGGGIAQAWEGMLEKTEQTIQEHAFKMEKKNLILQKAYLGEMAGIYGAGLMALNNQ